MNGHTLDRGTVRGMRGFSLIELMIVVAVIGIIAAVAFPSYQDSVWKGKRGEAKSAILKALQAEERYYTQGNAYLCYPSAGAGCTTNPSAAFPIFSGDNSTSSNYTLMATAGPVTANGTTLCAVGDIKQCVVVTATVVAGADPVCGTTLQMDSVGNKLSQAGTIAQCWK